MSYAAIFPPFGDDSYDHFVASQILLLRPEKDFEDIAHDFRVLAIVLAPVVAASLWGAAFDDGAWSVIGLVTAILVSTWMVSLARLSLLCELCAARKREIEAEIASRVDAAVQHSLYHGSAA